jgi:hypothetical protein
MPKFDMPDFKAPEMPDFKAPEMPKFTAPEMPKFTAPDMPKFTAPDMPKFTAPDMPKFTAPDMPKFTMPSMPDVGDATSSKAAKVEMPKFEAPSFKAPAFKAPDMPEFKAPAFSAPKISMPAMPSFSVPASSSSGGDYDFSDSPAPAGEPRESQEVRDARAKGAREDYKGADNEAAVRCSSEVEACFSRGRVVTICGWVQHGLAECALTVFLFVWFAPFSPLVWYHRMRNGLQKN